MIFRPTPAQTQTASLERTLTAKAPTALLWMSICQAFPDHYFSVQDLPLAGVVEEPTSIAKGFHPHAQNLVRRPVSIIVGEVARPYKVAVVLTDATIWSNDDLVGMHEICEYHGIFHVPYPGSQSHSVVGTGLAILERIHGRDKMWEILRKCELCDAPVKLLTSGCEVPSFRCTKSDHFEWRIDDVSARIIAGAMRVFDQVDGVVASLRKSSYGNALAFTPEIAKRNMKRCNKSTTSPLTYSSVYGRSGTVWHADQDVSFYHSM